MMVGAGALKERVILQREGGSTFDSRGQVTAATSTLSTVWARVLPLAGKEAITARQNAADATHQVTLRYSSDVSALAPAYWAQWGTRRLDVLHVANVENRNEYLELLCQELIPASTVST